MGADVLVALLIVFAMVVFIILMGNTRTRRGPGVQPRS